MEISPTIFVVPTGIGCDIGGFAGDALPTAKLLASASGCLITHPNVMNGGTLSEKVKNMKKIQATIRIFCVQFYSNPKISLILGGVVSCLFSSKTFTQNSSLNSK